MKKLKKHVKHVEFGRFGLSVYTTLLKERSEKMIQALNKRKKKN
ncbi:hypothetical protein [Bacillus changyiensis]|nr:hypothetical protein [Bacillus changyiensis]